MKGLEKLFDVLGEILAFVLVVLFAALIINANFEFIPDSVMVYLLPVKEWGGLALIAIVGLEAVSKRNIIIRLFFYICLAVTVIFMFFPGIYDQLTGMIK